MLRTRFIISIAMILVVGLLAGCQGASLGQLMNSIPVSPTQPTEAAEIVDTAAQASGAMATVNTRSLRVRAAPDSTAAVVAGIRQGEEYAVLGLSSDGQWVELEVPAADGGRGWVSANFVNVAGPITDAEVTAVATVEATEEAMDEATEEAMDEATEEAMDEATEVATEEAADAAMTEVVAPEAGMAAVNTEGVRLRVRAEPTTDAEIVGYAYPGEIFPVEEVSEDGVWVRIGGAADTENLDGGWVAAEFLLIGQ